MPEGGIFLSNDTYQKLSGDLFAQSAHGQIADTWAAQTTAALPDLYEQAHAAEQQRQADAAAAAKAAQDQKDAAAAQAQRDAAAADFEHLANLTLAQASGLAPGAAGPAPVPSTVSGGSDSSGSWAAGPADFAPFVASGFTGVNGVPRQGPIPGPVPPVLPPESAALPDAATTPLVAPAPPLPPVTTTPTLPLPDTATLRPLAPPTAATQTTAGLSGGGSASGQVGAQGQQIMASAADTASWLGVDGQKALQAVLLTEGGLAGARGDGGKSAGPLQFYEGGQLANFAQQHGLTLDDAKTFVEANPESAISWAIGTASSPGYLGAAILAGQQQGLTGPDLATYAQQHGQVSVSPERAGANWNALFGNGQDAVSASSSVGVMRVINAAVTNVANAARPSQFGVGLSDGDAYAACGPVAALAFARSTGRNPSAQEAVDLAKGVGWTQGAGMAGPSSEVELLKRLGVTSHLEAGADPNKMAQDIANGNPVMISTSGHYFTADGSRTGADGTIEFHVGTSGTDLKQGAEWMSLGRMATVMGPVQGTLYLDRQPGDGPSVAVQATTAASTAATAPPPATNPVGDAFSALGSTVHSGLSALPGIFGQTPIAGGVPVPSGASPGSPGIPTAAQMPTPSDTLTNPTINTNPLTPRVGLVAAPAPQPTIFDQAGSAFAATGARVEDPHTGDAFADARTRAMSALGTVAQSVTSPFTGKSEQFPTGGPLAGPGVGLGRMVAGGDQLKVENAEYGALDRRNQELLALAQTRPMTDAEKDEWASNHERMSQIYGQADISALAQRNPDIGNFEQQGSLIQGIAAAPLVAGEAPLALRALATVIDPSTGLPSVAGRAVTALRGVVGAGEAAADAGHLAAPVATDVADVAGRVIGGAQQAQAAVPFAVGLGGAAAAGGATYAATDPNDPNRLLKTGLAAVAGGTAAGGLAWAADSGALTSAARTLRSGPAPAMNASPQIRAAVNALDSGTREAAVHFDGYLARDLVTPAEHADLVNGAAGDFRAQFLRDVAGATDGVQAKVAGVARPEGWVDGANLANDPHNVLANVWLAPETTTVVNNILKQGPGEFLSGVGRAQGFIKNIDLAGSPFHMIQEEFQALRLGVSNAPGATAGMLGRGMWNAVNPRAYAAMRISTEWEPVFEQAARAGVTGLSARPEGEAIDMTRGLVNMGLRSLVGGAGAGTATYLGETAQGKPQDQALQDAGRNAVIAAIGAGPVAEFLGPAIFERQIPTLKVVGFDALSKSGVPDAVAASLVNQTFGGQNLVRIARDPTVQGVVRAVTLAPDWWEGWGRALYNTVSPGSVRGSIPLPGIGTAATTVGDASRKYVAVTAITSAIALEGLNQLFTGHLTDQNDPGHTLDLEIPKANIPGAPSDPNSGDTVHVDVLGPIKTIADLALSGNVLKFASGRMGIAPSLAIPGGLALSGQNVYNFNTGQPIVPKGATQGEALLDVAGYEASRVNPAGGSGIVQGYAAGGPGGAALAATTGLRVSTQTAKQEAQQQARAEAAAALLNAAGISTPTVPASVQVQKKGAGYDAASIDLTPGEMKAWEQARSLALGELTQGLVTDPSFTAQTQGERAAQLRPLVSQANLQATQQIIDAVDPATMDQRTAAHQALVDQKSGPISSTGQRTALATPTPLSLTPITTSPADNVTFPFGQVTKTTSCSLTGGGHDGGCTPGSVLNGVDEKAVSQSSYAKTVGTVPAAQKQAVYDAYGIPSDQASHYEIDHLVPLALGGSNHSSNLWPQPSTPSDQTAGYHQKDVVEVYLYQQVRAGRLPLADAQARVVNSWRDVYASLTKTQVADIAKSLGSLSPDLRSFLTN